MRRFFTRGSNILDLLGGEIADLLVAQSGLATGLSLVSQGTSELIAPHLRSARQVATLGLVVELLSGLRGAAPGALALSDRCALLAEGSLGALRHVGQRPLRPGAFL